MLCKSQYFLLLPLFLIFYSAASAQVNLGSNSIIYSTSEVGAIYDSGAVFTITDIAITGNSRTKDKIILRELTFQQSEQYPLKSLIEKFSESKKQLMNTGLFQEVVVTLKSIEENNASIEIIVKERWYIFPIPFVRVVDRNLQEWVKTQDMDLKRVNYGIALTHNNTTGRNDKLFVNLTNGYTKEVSINYEGLYIDKNLKWSTNFRIATGKNKEVNYATIGNRDVSYKDTSQFVHSFFRTAVEFAYRRAIKTKHTFSIGYHSENFLDTIFHLNPQFSFQNGRINYPVFSYRLQYFNVDFIPYPTKGHAADVVLEKKGINKNVNLWQLTARTSSTWPLSNKYLFNLSLVGSLKLPFNQPYISQQFMGYNNIYMQGYEDYVVNGVAAGITKATISRKLFSTVVHIPSERIKRLNNIPVRVYGKVYGNTGYIYNEQTLKNSLSNKFLYSGGVGLDIIIMYDLIFKVEWSINQLGQNGLYLHNRRYL
jgi:outer membrane protein assembly factor BamA